MDLAYALSNTFGEQFESWQKVNQTSSPSSKVELFSQFFELSTDDFLEVRHFVRTWESTFGDSATPQAMIEALQEVKQKPQDIIERISQNCL